MSEKPDPIHLYVYRAGIWRAYAIPFIRIQEFTAFQEIVNELLGDMSGEWEVVDGRGLILMQRFWVDLIVPGAKYYIAVRHDAGIDGGEEEPADSKTPKYGLPCSEVPRYMGAAMTVYNPRVHAVGLPTTSTNATSATVAVVTDYRLAEPSTTLEVTAAESAANPAAFSRSWAQIAAPSSFTSSNVSPGTQVKSKQRVVGNALTITVRDIECKVMTTLIVSRHISVGQLCERLGGQKGSRVQLLNRVAGGLLSPGATYMFGTKKTLAEAGWTGNVQLCFVQKK